MQGAYLDGDFNFRLKLKASVNVLLFEQSIFKNWHTYQTDQLTVN